MTSASRDAGSTPLIVTTLATLAVMLWGPAWLAFAALGIGSAWFIESRPARLKLGLALLAAVFALAVVNSVYDIGKDMALRDNARAETR